jgi:hypothetical protein
MRFYDFFRRLFNRSSKGVPSNGKGLPDELKKMLVQLENTQEVELTCDEVLAVLDQFAEAYRRGEDVARWMPLVQHHLDMCADCHEEFNALVRILRATSGQVTDDDLEML